MATQRTYSLDDTVIQRFEKFVPSGERSQIVNSLMDEYIKLKSPDKKALKLKRELERKEAEERLAKLMSIDKDEADAVLRENEKQQALLLAAQRDTAAQHFLDSCRKQAKLLVNVEFGLNPLDDFLPPGWNDSKRLDYKSRWKSLTEKLILEKKDGS